MRKKNNYNICHILRLLLNGLPDGISINASIQHGISVHRKLRTYGLEEGVQICRVSTTVVCQSFQIVYFPHKPGNDR